MRINRNYSLRQFVKETAIKLGTYTGEVIDVIGEMDTCVNYNMQKSNLVLTVVAGNLGLVATSEARLEDNWINSS